MSTRVTACSEASICVNYLVNMRLNQSYVLEVFLIFDEMQFCLYHSISVYCIYTKKNNNNKKIMNRIHYSSFSINISTCTLSFLIENQNWKFNLINQKHNYVLHRFAWDTLWNCKQTYYYKVSRLAPTKTL